MSHPSVLVLGARGHLGAAATAAFAGAGWRVFAQVRQIPAGPASERVTYLTTPLDDTPGLVRAAAGAAVVVHAVNPLYTRWDAELLPMARRGLAAAEGLGATFMLPGNVYNFGAAMPPVLREDTPQRPSTAKGRLRCALEGEIAVRCDAGRLRGVVIRAGDFFGGGAGDWFDQVIVKHIARGRLAYPGALDLAHAWAYLPDLAQAFVAVAERRRQVPGPAFQNLHFAGHTCTGGELLAQLEAVAGGLGLQAPHGWRRGGMPWGLIRAVGTVHPLWRELARMSYLWRVPHQLDGRALAAEVGALPTTPLTEALRSMLQQHGVGAGAAGGRAAVA